MAKNRGGGGRRTNPHSAMLSMNAARVAETKAKLDRWYAARSKQIGRSQDPGGGLDRINEQIKELNTKLRWQTRLVETLQNSSDSFESGGR